MIDPTDFLWGALFDGLPRKVRFAVLGIVGILIAAVVIVVLVS